MCIEKDCKIQPIYNSYNNEGPKISKYYGIVCKIKLFSYPQSTLGGVE